jgi:hypothetical protein
MQVLTLGSLIRPFWPKNLLPNPLPRSADNGIGIRQCCHKKLFWLVSKNNIFGNAKDLLHTLDRQSAKNRHLISVCYSLGRLIVKKIRWQPSIP